MDYVKPTGVRLALHVIVILLLIGYAGWAAQVLWRL
jgi:succinate dehydrogenase / fumarate reductase membrane anchor subunit